RNSRTSPSILVPTASVKSYPVAFVDEGLDLLHRLSELGMGDQRFSETRHPARVRPLRRLPKSRADHAFWAMSEHLLNRHHHPVAGQLCVNRHQLAELNVAHEDRRSADPESVHDARDQEDEPDIWMAENVAERIETTVAQPVGHGKCDVIKHLDET